MRQRVGKQDIFGMKTEFIYGSPTVFPRNLDSFYKVAYYIKWVRTSWTYSITLSFIYPVVRSTERIMLLISDVTPIHQYRDIY